MKTNAKEIQINHSPLPNTSWRSEALRRLPLLARFAIMYPEEKCEFEGVEFDPFSEVCISKFGASFSELCTVGTCGTRAGNDPTADESSDR